jgi:predicted dehydrogenase
MASTAGAPIEAVLLGAGHRGFYYQGMYAHTYPHRLRYVAVAEPNPVLRDRFGDFHCIPLERRYASWNDVIAAGQLAPVLVNTTPDRVHADSTIAALEAGYNVLLEKPMATSPEDCVRIVRAAERASGILHIHHCARYAPFFQMVHEVVSSGRLGQVVSYAHVENVFCQLMAHSYVRGNWRRAETCGPMILTKCCHDLDLIHWYTSRRSRRLYSYGSLRHFRAEHAPPGGPERCTDGCPIEDECPYYAPGWYLSDDPAARVHAQAITVDPSADAVLQALRAGPYGRCVYRCDNDVVDNQVVLIEMDDGTNVSLTMQGYSPRGGRYMRLDGSRQTLLADEGRREIEVHDHRSGRRDVLHVGTTTGGHGGGDDGCVSAFLRSVREGERGVLTSARASLESHLMAFAAEASRLSGKPIDMDAYRSALGADSKLDAGG